MLNKIFYFIKNLFRKKIKMNLLEFGVKNKNGRIYLSEFFKKIAIKTSKKFGELNHPPR